MQDKDIVAAAIDHMDCVVQVFFIRGGKMIGREAVGSKGGRGGGVGKPTAVG